MKMAGLLTYSLSETLPIDMASTVVMFQTLKLTAAGTVLELHKIPVLIRVSKTKIHGKDSLFF
jgi:hypothetical protein